MKFSPTCSYISLTRFTTLSHWELFKFDKMGVSEFEILLIVVTFYLNRAQKNICSKDLICNVPDKYKQNNYNGDRRLKG